MLLNEKVIFFPFQKSIEWIRVHAFSPRKWCSREHGAFSESGGQQGGCHLCFLPVDLPLESGVLLLP